MTKKVQCCDKFDTAGKSLNRQEIHPFTVGGCGFRNTVVMPHAAGDVFPPRTPGPPSGRGILQLMPAMLTYTQQIYWRACVISVFFEYLVARCVTGCGERSGTIR